MWSKLRCMAGVCEDCPKKTVRRNVPPLRQLLLTLVTMRLVNEFRRASRSVSLKSLWPPWLCIGDFPKGSGPEPGHLALRHQPPNRLRWEAVMGMTNLSLAAPHRKLGLICIKVTLSSPSELCVAKKGTDPWEECHHTPTNAGVAGRFGGMQTLSYHQWDHPAASPRVVWVSTRQ
jgi:hypothetical protein